jgi:hypothetical protein
MYRRSSCVGTWLETMLYLRIILYNIYLDEVTSGCMMTRQDVTIEMIDMIGDRSSSISGISDRVMCTNAAVYIILMS